MKLSIKDINILGQVLKTTGDFTPDNKPVVRTFSGKQLSALRWFDKNTKEVTETYQEFFKEVKKEHEKKFAEETKNVNETIGKLSKFIKVSKEKEEKDRVGVYTAAQAVLRMRSPEKEIDKSLNDDKALTKVFSEDLHDIKIEKNTLELLGECLNDYKFTLNHADLLDNEEIAKLIDD